MQTTEGTASNGVPLHKQHRARIEPLLHATGAALGIDCPAEYSFNNLLLFNDVHRYRIIDADDGDRWPAIAGVTYDGMRHLLPLFDLQTAPPDVLQHLLIGRDALYPLAAAQTAALPPEAFRITSERADADYLYPAQNFLDYPGRQLHDKRRQVAQLLARHRLEARTVEADCSGADAVLDGWIADKASRAHGADVATCRQALQWGEQHGLRGFVHRADGIPAGLVIAEPLYGGVWAVRFAKGLARFHGIYPYLFQHMCRSLQPAAKWLNFEQDLGVAGFRQSKLSYAPERLLPKLRAYPKNGSG